MVRSSGQFHFQGYSVDANRWQVHWQDELVTLNQKTFELLLYLIQHCDRVVGKNELMSTLWPDLIVEEGNITQQVFLLRSALSRHASKVKIIETVARRGYRFAVPFDVSAPIPVLPTTARECSAVEKLQSAEQIELDAASWTIALPTKPRHRTVIAGAICLLFAIGGYQLRGLRDREAATAQVLRGYGVHQLHAQ